jgi:hypothetical protein
MESPRGCSNISTVGEAEGAHPANGLGLFGCAGAGSQVRYEVPYHLCSQVRYNVDVQPDGVFLYHLRYLPTNRSVHSLY